MLSWQLHPNKARKGMSIVYGIYGIWTSMIKHELKLASARVYDNKINSLDHHGLLRWFASITVQIYTCFNSFDSTLSLYVYCLGHKGNGSLNVCIICLISCGELTDLFASKLLMSSQCLRWLFVWKRWVSFTITDPLWRESIGDQWFPSQSSVIQRFSASILSQTIDVLKTWNAIQMKSLYSIT